MEGAYLAHSVYGFFQNGGALLDRARRRGQRRGAAPAGRPARRGRHVVEAFRAQALAGRSTAVKVELTEEPKAGEGDARPTGSWSPPGARTRSSRA